MKYTSDFFQHFLKEVEKFSSICQAAIDTEQKSLSDNKKAKEQAITSAKNRMISHISRATTKRKGLADAYEKSIRGIEAEESDRRKKIITEITIFKECLAEIEQKYEALKSSGLSLRPLEVVELNEEFLNSKDFQDFKNSEDYKDYEAIEEIKDSIATFGKKVAEVQEAAKNPKTAATKITRFEQHAILEYTFFSIEIAKMQTEELFANQKQVDSQRNQFWDNYTSEAEGIEEQITELQEDLLEKVYSVIKEAQAKRAQEDQRARDLAEAELSKATQEFMKAFPPLQLEEEYFRVYHAEPSVDHYVCMSENPENIKIGTIEFPVSSLQICEYALDFLCKNYFFLIRNQGKSLKNKVFCFPYCITFDDKFNYVFEVNESNRELLVDRTRSIVMRLFMQIPPHKINFIFCDPVKSGETFAMFTRMSEVDDRTNSVINEKIWTAPADIEEKLRITTDHIANVIQRCLQGQYENIQAYNMAARENAEPYQLLMLMDFPEGFNENSLKLLEQIISTGPKCGVYTVILKSAEQYAKIDEKKLKPLVNNIMGHLTRFTATQQEIVFDNLKYKGKQLTLHIQPFLTAQQLDKVIPVLKAGIKNAERVVIKFNKILPNKTEYFTGDSTSSLSIPIGIHGANNIQNLTLGVGGSHHALIVGQTGSGKSSLMHTIIMSSIIKYPADQLQIFLVDFKRGVEFKIYANYNLENFKVIAIESEREFGSSVLEYLDQEQSRRSEKFKRINVDNIEDYRLQSREVLPRMLLIVDEFQVMFSKDTMDMSSKKSSTNLERLIKQGRAFGIHVILSSQSVTNISGLDNSVWGQVGVRIALNCPKTDAKFVLGSNNDGADLLSADNPGQAIYNSDCGKAVNTVFRVAYIEQKEQDEHLKFISDNTPKFGYPDTRVMVSNVEDNIYNIFQKFISGQQVDFNESRIYVGESLKLEDKMRMIFKRKQSSNLLVVSNDEEKARTLFTFATLSLALHNLSQRNYQAPTTPHIYLFDYAPMETFGEADILFELIKMLPGYVKYIPFDNVDEEMGTLYSEFVQREKGLAPIEDTYMIIYGLHRARNLRSNTIYKESKKFEDFDEFGGEATTRETLSVKPYDMFLNLLQRGATVGINTLIWEDNFKIFMNYYADMLPNFDMRIAFTMPDDDSINFIEEVNGSKIGDNSAIYNYNGNQKFRPYKRPDFDWLKKICTRMAGFPKQR